MQPFAAPPSPEVLASVWHDYCTRDAVPDTIDPFVLASWRRCAPLLNPQASPPMLGGESNALRMDAAGDDGTLRNLARPVMEDIYQYTESARLVLLLLNANLTLIDSFGDPKLIQFGRRVGIDQGMPLGEPQIGTSAFGIAQHEGVPAWVFGAEHYLRLLHGFSSSAAPIHSPEGELLGLLGIMEPVGTASVKSMGIVTAGAVAIETKIEADLIQQEATTRAIQINTIIDSISDGVLAWDRLGTVRYLNQRAGQLLKLRPSSVTGRSLHKYIRLPAVVRSAAEQEKKLRNVECRLSSRRAGLQVLLNLHEIYDGQRPLSLVTFRAMDEVRDLITRQVGAIAHQTTSDLIGESPLIKRTRRQIETAARGNACVLIEGESGTGKNTAARAIHNSSPRSNGPFSAINCRAIPRDLVLTEFLGFESGSYTHIARGGQPSKFELADRGTLYLDEIDTLPLDMQAALLHVIETGTVLRLGGRRPKPVNVRIIASSSESLERLVREGAFRPDLYYRLRSFQIMMPPLRERPADIPLLIRQKLATLSAQINRNMGIEEKALDLMAQYHWPGNIRELESLLERIAGAAEDNRISIERLPSSILSQSGRAVLGHDRPVNDPPPSLAELERQAILRAGQWAGGNLTRTASVLGVGRSTLWRKMKEMNIQPDDFELKRSR